MRTLLALVLLTFVLGCGDGGPAPADEDDLRLPVVGMLGALPPADGAVVITLKADGVLLVDTKPCTWDDLADRLDDLTRPPDDPKRKRLKARLYFETIEEDVGEADDDTENPFEQEVVPEEPVIKDAEITEEDTELPADESGAMGWTELTADQARKLQTPGVRPKEPVAEDFTRNADMLLRIDRRVPWTVVVRLLMTLALPELRTYRTFYGVEGRDGRGEGAVAVFLPQDRGCGRKTFVNADVQELRLRAKPGEGELDPDHLAEAMLTRMEAQENLLAVSITAPPEAPFGVVMTAVDAALRARALSIVFEGHALRKTPVAELCAKAEDAGPFHVHVAGKAVTMRPTAGPDAPRRLERYVGTTNVIPLLLEPVIKDEALDEDER